MPETTLRAERSGLKMIEDESINLCDFDQVSAHADRVIELAEEYRTPLVPKAYEVWFSYVCGKNRSIAERVNAIIDGGSSVSPYDLDQIYSEFLNPARREGDNIRLANAKLDQEMDEILHLIDGHLASGAEFSGSLDKEARSLSDNASPDKIRQTIEFLLVENNKMRIETANLSSSLQRSKDQIHNLRSSLEKSRKNEMLDPLTKIPNRRQLEVFLAEHMKRAHETDTALTFVMADLDHFKHVNDRFGHLIGDEVLKYFAGLLSKHIRATDLSARYGGEEFAMVFLDVNAEKASIIVERMRMELEKAHLVVTKSKQPLGTITASFGMAEFYPGDDWASLVKRADTNLYAAKNAGRNRIIYDEWETA